MTNVGNAIKRHAVLRGPVKRDVLHGEMLGGKVDQRPIVLPGIFALARLVVFTAHQRQDAMIGPLAS